MTLVTAIPQENKRTYNFTESGGQPGPHRNRCAVSLRLARQYGTL